MNTSAEPDETVRRIEAEIGKPALDSVNERTESDVQGLAAGLTTASAWIHHYLLIDFGFTGGGTYEPNSIQFYSATGFLCSKRTDNNSIQTLAPILACKYVSVTWDTATLESVHIMGMQPKP
jgi:hypothetical protein